MPVKYIPKPIELVNTKAIAKLELDISELSRAQTKALDKFITLLKPCNRRSDLREDVSDLVFEFFDFIKSLKAKDINNTIRSIENQINRRQEYKQDPKHFKFEIPSELIEYLQSQETKPKAKPAKA